MKLSEIRGSTTLSSEKARKFVQTWFHPDDRISIVGIRSQKTGRMDTLSQSMLAKEFIADIADDELFSGLIFDREDGSCWNLYVGVCPVKDDVSLLRRGTEENVAYVPGVWADIDIKDNGFKSEQEILDWLKTLPLRPTMICGSGSGGVHAYWRLHWGQKGNKEMGERWWAYLDEMAGAASIDKLIDTTRILRIPGSLHFPKHTTSAHEASRKLGQVKLHEASGLTYDAQQFLDISHDAFERRKAERARIIMEDSERRLFTDGLVRDMLKGKTIGRWKLLRAIAYMEDMVNDMYTWREILEPHGWTWLKEQRDGSWEIARPGRNERSAVVDYDGSPVMSLLSSSNETGFFDLKDAGIPITRYRALLRLNYNEDAAALVNDVLARHLGGDTAPYAVH